MFSEKTFDFLFENRMENSREWFAEHRAEYDAYVLQPLTELAKRLGPALEEIDRELVTTPRVNKVISRINRDVRFSNDKSLYRDTVWLSFKRDKHWYVQYPEFYFVASRRGFFYGCGYYCPTPEATAAIRELILARDKRFLQAKKALESDARFVLDGDPYKRSRFPGQPEDVRCWLDRKVLRVELQSDDLTMLYTDDLAERMLADYRALAPVYRFFLYAESSRTL